MYKISLKFRIVLSLVIIVTVTSGLFATGVLLLKQQLEEVIFGNMVHDQLILITEQLEHSSYDETKLFEGWAFYYGVAAQNLEPEITRLSLGTHHSVQVNDEYFQIEVGQWQGNNTFLTYDITDWEYLEHELLHWLAYGIGILAAVTILMGIGTSRAILAPVAAFTQRLQGINPNERNVQVAKEFTGNEISQIANAFDNYLSRMDQFVDRERSFTAAASHELRNPLSVMLGALDILESSPQDAPSKRAIERLKRACAEMLAFIEATLFLSREDSKTIHQKSHSDLTDIIRALAEENSRAMEDKHIELKLDIQNTLTLTQPDSIIKITLGNVLRNAIEHTQHGQIQISVHNNTCIIRDSGEGISADNLPKIFERSYSTKQQGTGMGLNLVRRICDRFNWEIDVVSKIDSGTVITLSFPDSSLHQ